VAGWARPSTWAWTRALGQPQALGPAREDGQRPGSGSTLAHQAILASAAVRRAVPDVYPITCRPGQDAREHWKTPRKGSKVPAVGRPWNRWTRRLDERAARLRVKISGATTATSRSWALLVDVGGAVCFYTAQTTPTGDPEGPAEALLEQTSRALIREPQQPASQSQPVSCCP
jgi:hypothetical protein